MLANSTGVIDAGYRDEIKMAITNFGNEPVEITDGQRLAQFLVIHRPKLELNLVQDDDSFRQGDRGGGVGSTGK
jgi:dUTP pyrophosphatase